MNTTNKLDGKKLVVYWEGFEDVNDLPTVEDLVVALDNLTLHLENNVSGKDKKRGLCSVEAHLKKTPHATLGATYHLYGK